MTPEKNKVTKIIILFKSILNLLYKGMCRKDTEKKVLFMSRQSNRPSVDFELLADRISEEHPDYSIEMLCRMMGGGLKGKASYAFHILKQIKSLSKSRIVILDSYCIPVSILRHRDHQVIAQIWHSIGTMKKNSFSILDRPEGRSSAIAEAMDMHKNYDVIFCAGEGYRGYLAESFNYPPEALTIVPLPRVDLLRDKEYQRRKRDDILAKYPSLAGGKNIVYAPTFRKGEDEREPFRKATEALKEAIAGYGDKYNLIVKAHPLSDVESDCKEYSTMDMLSVCDYFISDYSCVVYEAGVMRIPFFFYAYDFDEYMSRRSVYIDYPGDLPGGMYRTAADIIRDIDAGNYDAAAMEEFVNKYVELPDGSAAHFLIKEIFSKSGGKSWT